MENTYKGYRIRASAIGYSVYRDNACVACGGVLGLGEDGNRNAARVAVREIIAGKRKPLSLPVNAGAQ